MPAVHEGTASSEAVYNYRYGGGAGSRTRVRRGPLGRVYERSARTGLRSARRARARFGRAISMVFSSASENWLASILTFVTPLPASQAKSGSDGRLILRLRKRSCCWHLLCFHRLTSWWDLGSQRPSRRSPSKPYAPVVSIGSIT